MSILDDFDLNESAEISRNVVGKDPDGRPIKTPSIIDTYDCLFWEGSTGESLKSDRFREEVSATIALYPGADIKKDDIATISGDGYHVLGSDNLGHIDEALIVYLKEIT